MSRVLHFAILTVAAQFCLAAPAQATLWTAYNVPIDGLQETPPVATPGYGYATVTFDDITGEMNVNGTFADLIGTANNAHVHGYAASGTPAGVVFGLTFTPNTSGTVTGMGIIPAGNITDVLSGLTYINIHSTFRTGGEIRGQITNFVPEPSTFVLAALALLGVVALRRRRA